jgi:hypothetical protein
MLLREEDRHRVAGMTHDVKILEESKSPAEAFKSAQSANIMIEQELRKLGSHKSRAGVGRYSNESGGGVEGSGSRRSNKVYVVGGLG